MEIIHVFKDGSKTTELKDVYIPDEIVKRVHGIVTRKDDEKRK